MIPIEVKFMRSFGNFPFGSSTKDAELFFGTSEETEIIDGMDGSSSLVWHYWEKGFSLFFDRLQTEKFCCVEVDNSVHLIFDGIHLFTLGEKELKNELSKKGYKDLEEEQHEWGEKRITFDDAMADFYFENGKLISINYSVSLSNENDSDSDRNKN